jgi:hypothetical protein
MLVSVGMAAMLSGCLTLQAYDGAKQPRAELAVIKGDTRFRPSAPVNLILRSVDERRVDAGYSAVSVEPGEHELLVDCLVNYYKTETRHALKIDVDSGVYRLVPDMAPGNRTCANVHLEKTG